VTRLVEVVAAADPALAPYAVSEPGPGRFADVEGVRGFVLEAVYEGYLLHYGESRAFVGMDADLRLLAGDALYAEGLARLAASGDTEAVSELADLISLCAWAESAARRDLVEALWEASARRLLSRTGQGARAEVAGQLAQDRA